MTRHDKIDFLYQYNLILH